MAPPIHDTCCGCIDLKKGCFIIGYITLVVVILANILLLSLMVMDFVIPATGYEGSKGELRILAFMLLLMALFLVFTITLLVGLHKNKRGHVKAYWIFGAVFLVLLIILFVLILVLDRHPVRIVIFLMISILHAYFVLVIRRQDHKMDGANEGAIYNTA